MRLSRSTARTLLFAALTLALTAGLCTCAMAQDTTNDTAQAPPPAEAAAQPDATTPSEPTAQPAAQPETTSEQPANEAVESSEQPAEQPATQSDEPQAQPAGDTSAAPEQRPSESTADEQQQEPTSEPAADTSAQRSGETDAVPAEQPAGAATTPEPASTPSQGTVNPDAPYDYIQFTAGEKPIVEIETSLGNMEVELWPDVAPRHCKSFVHLIKSGYYDSLTIHRVVPGFVIQGGDPLGNGTGGPGYKLRPEFSDLPHKEGTLSMARLPSDPSSAGSQFFICLGRLQSLDGQYTIFGQVTGGLDVLHQIEKVPVQAERPKTPIYLISVKMKSGEAAETSSESPGRDR